MQAEPNDHPATRIGSRRSKRARVRDCRESSVERRVAWCMTPIVCGGVGRGALHLAAAGKRDEITPNEDASLCHSLGCVTLS